MLTWKQSSSPISYPDALEHMTRRVDLLKNGGEEEVWLLEHSPLYTAGSSAKPTDLIDPKGIPVFKSGRGGQFTYHGPGQRIAYVMIDLTRRAPDLRRYVSALEQWIIDTLADFHIKGERREGRVGIWIVSPSKNTSFQEPEEKIAAIGVRVSKWITFHGIAINVHPNLEHYNGIIPCGLPNFGVTSFQKLGTSITLEELDAALIKNWQKNSFLNLMCN